MKRTPITLAAAWRPLLFVVAGWQCVAAAAPSPTDRAAAIALGSQFFDDVRFSQVFAGRDLRATTTEEPFALAKAVSCRSCHFVRPSRDDQARRVLLSFADDAPRSRWPDRGDGREATPRNSPSLVDIVSAHGPNALLHFDGEFTSLEALVRETFLSRNYGWLADEREEAIRHIARVIREDPGGALVEGECRLSYSILLAGASSEIPLERRLPVGLRLDVGSATDKQIIERVGALVLTFLESLQFSRDVEGRHDGSPYDAFLSANRLARAPERRQTAAEYARRLAEQIAVLRAPKYLNEPVRRLRVHDQPFGFGEREFQGMRIFFRSAISPTQKTGAGNCAECHPPPHFSDLKFHNTGVAQDSYDLVHGTGAFARMMIPDTATRAARPDTWLPPSAQHPRGRAPLLAPVRLDAPEHADLGLWNVYANPAIPAPQAALEKLLNPAGLSADAALARAIGRFKTSMLRSPGQSAPYFHTAHAATIEDAVQFYQRMSSLAHEGKMRNAPPEYFGMRLGPDDIAPLAAFLRALNEDYVGPVTATDATRASGVDAQR